MIRHVVRGLGKSPLGCLLALLILKRHHLSKTAMVLTLYHHAVPCMSALARSFVDAMNVDGGNF